MKTLSLLLLAVGIVISCDSEKSYSTEENKSFKGNEVIPDFQKNYVGTINKNIKVIFQLKNINGQIQGFYFYTNRGINIKLAGKILGNRVILEEFDYLNNKKAQMSGIITSSDITGEWKSLESNKAYSLTLKETKETIPALPENIEGIYKIKGDSSETVDCNLIVKIYRKTGEYFYNFKSDVRTLNGKVSFSRDVGDSNIGINLEGIEWAEYEGDISHQDEENHGDSSLELPVGVNGLLDEDGIRIQNSGNAMNYYTKLDDCGQKYIHLKK